MKIALAFAVLILGVSFQAHATVSLQNSQWKVEIEPETFAIRVLPGHQKAVQATVGTLSLPVSKLQTAMNKASWQWGNYSCSADLQGPDLFLSITSRSPGSLEILRQPSATLGKALILPLAEGHYVPLDNATWRDFLTTCLREVNTSEGLSLPLWGMDYGDDSLYWILINPFNSRLVFGIDSHKKPELSLCHEFTQLSPQTPFTFLLHLGGADPLAGAKRYRALLISEGRYESLASKIRKTPETKKLLGATHLYLWANGLLAPSDIKDWSRFLAQLRGDTQLKESLSPEVQNILRRSASPLLPYQKRILIADLDRALEKRARSQWLGETFHVETLVKSYLSIKEDVAKRFSSALDPDPSHWGGMRILFQQLANSGLKRLWIGLGDGWGGGLWHPEAVAAAVKYGFLIAPYDSYETALPLTGNQDWTTACLGADAPAAYGIVQKSGKLQPGFQGQGCYTNPCRIRPLLEARIQAIQRQAGFNSWFLDAYGTGMVFDDYRPGKEMTMAQMAMENEMNSRWIAETLHLPTGSEGGNATTSGGIAFAEGMQTPFFAWTEDFKKKTSPSYLGGWWPPENPAIFFRPVIIREPYRTVYFDPTMRLPLYQAVFHGAIITTHHWSFDSLKLSNVRKINELAQLLYNVPPLYHLSAATMSERLPQIVRQDAFFRPLHEHLGLQSLTDFRWLSQDHLVQQTVFSDGTRLVANFGEKPYYEPNLTLPAYAIAAFLPHQSPMIYRTAKELRPHPKEKMPDHSVVLKI